MMIRTELTEDERREIKSAAAKAGVSVAKYATWLLRYAVASAEFQPLAKGENTR